MGATLVDEILFGILLAVGLLDHLVALAIVGGLGMIIYQILMIGNGGRTLGNMVVGTRVVHAGTGGLPGYGKATIRVAVQILLGAVPFIGFIGAILDDLWPLWDPQNQTLHDKAAGTVVLRN